MHTTISTAALILQLAGGEFSTKNSRGPAGFGNAEDLHHELRKIDLGYLLGWFVISLIIGCPIIHWVKWHPWWIAGGISLLVGVITYYWRYNSLEKDGPDEKERKFIRKWRSSRRAVISSGLLDYLTAILQSYGSQQFDQVIQHDFKGFLEINIRAYLLQVAGKMVQLETSFRSIQAMELEGSDYLPTCRFAESLGISVHTCWREAKEAVVQK